MNLPAGASGGFVPAAAAARVLCFVRPDIILVAAAGVDRHAQQYARHERRHQIAQFFHHKVE